jgi:hypothetical protein
VTATKKTRRRTTPVRLSQRGVAVVALAVAGLAVAAATGHQGVAALLGSGLYLLVSGRATAVAAALPTARQVLRGIAWTVAATATLVAVQGTTAPGGATLGLALAAALATALKLTATSRRR